MSAVPAAVVFDCDGVLVDSEPHSVEAWCAVLDDIGHPAARSEVEACLGLGFEPTWRILDALSELPTRDEVWRRVMAALEARFDDPGLETFTDAVGTLKACLDRGVAVAIVSASPRQRLDLTLDRSGLGTTVAVTVSGDDVDDGKPAPDAYLLAADRLGADPATCVAVEDTATGAASAAAAGMHVVAVVRHESHRGALLTTGADVVDTLTPEAVGL